MAGVILRACPVCGEVTRGMSRKAVDAALLAHLTAELEQYMEEEVVAGRAVRVLRDGKTLYRQIDGQPAQGTDTPDA